MPEHFDAETQRMMLAIEANWDERAPIHAASAFYRGRQAEDWFAEFEWDDLGTLAGKDVLHLQCHLGTETIAFARRGARTVGLDLSSESITRARELAPSVQFVQSNVYDAVEVLGAQRFDVIYTGKGALCYLPDLTRWADVVTRLLRPGGRVYVVEFHPLLNALGVVPPPDGSQELLLRNDFLGGRGVVRRDATRTYTDGPALVDAVVSYEWMHGIGEVVSSLVGAGLRIDRLRESELLPWPRWPSMIPAGGWFRLPDSAPRIPLLYGLLASKPTIV